MCFGYAPLGLPCLNWQTLPARNAFYPIALLRLLRIESPRISIRGIAHDWGSSCEADFNADNFGDHIERAQSARHAAGKFNPNTLGASPPLGIEIKE